MKTIRLSWLEQRDASKRGMALSLSKYHSRMKIIRRAGKQHANADGLSRLQEEQSGDQGQVREADTWAVSIMGLDKDFIDEVRTGLQEDPTFAAVIRKLDALEARADKSTRISGSHGLGKKCEYKTKTLYE